MMMTFNLPTGNVYDLFTDMLEQTHLLVAGASGSGKSVLVNGLIVTALYDSPFDTVGGKQLILIDPKRTELSPYRNLPHCLRYASEPADMLDTLQFAVALVERRYKQMEIQGLRTYKGSDVYVIIEELADLMTTCRKVVQPLIQRLCQIARAAKVHVWAITQTPIVAVIPTPIKVNFDGIVALRTRSAQDSRNIIGAAGAEKLPRYGECLYYTPSRTEIEHYRVPFITEYEQQEMIQWWVRQYQAQKEAQNRTRKGGLLRRLFG